MKLANVEYQAKNKMDVSRSNLLVSLFKSLEKYLPEAMNELEKEPLESYKRYVEYLHDDKASQKDSENNDEIVKKAKLMQGFDNLIDKWAYSHNIDDETLWNLITLVKRKLYNILQERQLIKGLRKIEDFQITNDLSFITNIALHDACILYPDEYFDELPFSMEFPGWNPLLKTRSDAENKIRYIFEQQLKNYLDEQELNAQKKGLERTPERREHELEQHLKMFIFYQYKKYSYDKIAKDNNSSKQNVISRVREIACLLKIPLRKPLRPGRPRKQPKHTD